MSRRRRRVLVVEDDAPLAEQLRWALKNAYSVRIAGDRSAAVDEIERWRPDLILLDLCLPPGGTVEEGFAVIEAARKDSADTMVIVLSAVEEREPALRAVSQGAYDFFSKPVDLQTLKIVIDRALERLSLVRENRRLREELCEQSGVNGIVGVSRAMQRVFDSIRRVADSPITVILEGESGTGKELVARAIHCSGSRREGPFVPVHCAALPDGLLEAELFGHEKGAFTGAVASRVGRFEAADGGTLFLDEVSCLSLQTQIKLLRILDERTVERLGSNRRRPVDSRLIVATNEDIASKVERGEFREDLFFRINVFPIHLPALRDRIEDIPLLAEHFLKRVCSHRKMGTKRFAPDALRNLMARDWPGNVRELLNLVETVALLTDAEVIQSNDLPGAWNGLNGRPAPALAKSIGLKAAVREFERRLLVEAIARADGVKQRAARELGLDASQMKYLVHKHDL